jgi:hypothetical protein
MGRHIAPRWVFAACFGCTICGGAMAQAGPANSVARYLGVGWSEGRHARNNSPQSLHPSKPWSFPITKLWNNQSAGPFGGSDEGHNQVPEGAIASPLVPQQYQPQQHVPPQVRPQQVVPPPRTPTPAKPRREELRGGQPGENEERSPSDEAPHDLPPSESDHDEMDLPPPPPLDDEPLPLETRSPRSIMRKRPTGR